MKFCPLSKIFYCLMTLNMNSVVKCIIYSCLLGCIWCNQIIVKTDGEGDKKKKILRSQLNSMMRFDSKSRLTLFCCVLLLLESMLWKSTLKFKDRPSQAVCMCKQCLLWKWSNIHFHRKTVWLETWFPAQW